MKHLSRAWLAAMALGTVALPAADPLPFAPRAHWREPSAPRLTSAPVGDILRNAWVTASHFETGQPPEFAHDGNIDDNIIHWGATTLPAWIRFDLPEPRPLAQVGLWFFASRNPVHAFCVEGSADGTNWQMLVDRRDNTEPATLRGFTFDLPAPVTVRSLRITVTGTTAGADGVMLLEVAARAERANRELPGAVGDIHRRYGGGDLPPAGAAPGWSATAWRGERVHGQFLVWTAAARTGLRAELSALTSATGAVLPAAATRVRLVRQVRADGALVGDRLEDATRTDLPADSYRVLWLTVEPPRDAAPGRYTGKLTVRADGTDPREFPLTLEVLAATLPAAADKKFHLDLWQHPWAIARWHDVAPWSEEHLRLMRPYLTELAGAGQKVITTTITDRPWGRRDYDDYRSMVGHLRQADGSWSFDYTGFDRYVEFARSCGITEQINCYSLLTWSGRLYYTDAATGDERFALCDPTRPEFADYWAPFLRDFERHLAAKGWLERTRLAVDEAPAPMMKAMTDLVRAHAPRLRISLAGNQAPSHYTGLDLAEFSIILDHASDELIRDIAKRRVEGRITTFYVCLDPKRPNTFVASPPAEAVWIGYHAAANGYDGFLRWAWTTWPENPQRDTTYWGHPYHLYLPAGDTFLLYPGPESSIRWELLRDGFEEWEKLRCLQDAAGGRLAADVAKALEAFRDPKALGDDTAVIGAVEAMRAAVEAAARKL